MSPQLKEHAFLATATAASFGICWYLGIGEKTGELLKAIGMAVGGNWLSEYSGHYVKKLKERWLNNDNPIINHHIQKALIESYKKSLTDILKTYESELQKNKLLRDEKKLIKEFLNLVSELSEVEFMKSINESFNVNELFQYISQDPKQVELALSNRLKLDSQSSLSFFKNEFKIEPRFIEYFFCKIPERMSFYFREELKKGNEAKQAMDLLYNETIRLHVNMIPSLATKLDKQNEILNRLIGILEIQEKDKFEIQLQTVTKLHKNLNEFIKNIKKQPRLKYDYSDIGKKSKTIFRSRYVSFVGRQTEIIKLKCFFYSESKFCWDVISGSAGSGKSRLAMELCFELNKEADILAGFLDRQVLEKFDWLDWKPAKPTLIVVDYASANYKTLIQLIKDLQDPWQEYEFPVRLLLLERELSGKWWEEISYEIENLKISEPFTSGSILLNNLDDETIWNIFLDVFTKENCTIPKKEETLSSLKKIDDKGRPIFAIFTAFAISSGKNVTGWNSSQLLQNYLQREEKEIWAKPFNNDYGLLEKYKNLLVVVTLCGGITSNRIPSILNTHHLPEPKQSIKIIKSLYSILSLENDKQVFSSLEPDILGEFFVLQQLEYSGKQQEILKKIAWNLSPAGYVLFITKAFQDFPNQASLFNWKPDSKFDKKSISEYCYKSLEIFQLAQSNCFSKLNLSDLTVPQRDTYLATNGFMDHCYKIFRLFNSYEWKSIGKFTNLAIEIFVSAAHMNYIVSRQMFEINYLESYLTRNDRLKVENLGQILRDKIRFFKDAINEVGNEPILDLENSKFELEEDISLQKAVLEIISKNFETSMFYLTESIKKNSNNVNALYYRGVIRSKLNDIHNAIADFTFALQINPNHIHSLLKLIEVKIKLGNEIEILKDFETLIKLDTVLGYEKRSDFYMDIKKYDEAISDLTEIIKIETDASYAYNNRGWCKNRLSKYDEAIKDLDMAIKINKNPYAYKHKAFSLMMKNELDVALLNVNKAIELKNDFAFAYTLRGEIFMLLKKNEKAIKDFNRAMDLGDNDAKEKLLQISPNFQK